MFINPSDVKITKVSEKDNIGVFTFEPLPMGFGHTLGNTLRRVLLTSLKGAAITQVKIAGVVHQFSTIPGVKEDVVELSLNLKKIRIKMYGNNPVVARIDKTGGGVVTAGDIEVSSEVEILNKDLHIATLSDKRSKFEAELVIESGTEYSPVEERETSKIGVILLDAMFSPVIRATYTVDLARMGRTLGLDKLILTVETNGAISPSEAVLQASTFLKDFFSRFSQGEDKVLDKKEDGAAGKEGGNVDDVSLDELPLPTRTINALRKHGIESLKQLVKKSDEELSDIKNLGEKSVSEIKKLLSKEGLR